MVGHMLPFTLPEIFFAIIGAFAIVGAAFVTMPTTHLTFPRMVERRRRGFLVGAVALYLGLLAFPYARDAIDTLISSYG